VRIVDTDVHHSFASWHAIVPYLPPAFQRRVIDGRGRGLARHGFRKISEFAAPLATDPSTVAGALTARGVDRAILNGSIHSLGVQPNMDFAAAIARAINCWTFESWVRPHPLFRGSILIAQQDPAAAVAEIEHWAATPGMVQVLMCSASESPYGRRQYHPIYAACERHGLPLALHLGGEGAGVSAPSTPVGHPSTYFEWYSALPQAYMAHLTSMVSEGVFERFPGLRVVLCEGGIAWLPHVVWRFEKNFKAVRAETPWLSKLPSAYVWKHFRFTSYPLEEFRREQDLGFLMRLVHGETTVMFSTGYPDTEFGDPFAMVDSLPERYREAVLAGTALTLYGGRLAVARA